MDESVCRVRVALGDRESHSHCDVGASSHLVVLVAAATKNMNECKHHSAGCSGAATLHNTRYTHGYTVYTTGGSCPHAGRINNEIPTYNLISSRSADAAEWEACPRRGAVCSGLFVYC